MLVIKVANNTNRKTHNNTNFKTGLSSFKEPMSIELPIYMVFVDYEKTFDSINHEAGFETLKIHRVEEKFFNIFKKTYDGGTVQV